MPVKRLYLISLALAFILLLSYSGASPTSATNSRCIVTGTAIPIGQCVLSSFPIALLGIGISLFIIAIAFMVNVIFNLKGLKAWYVGELWEVTKSMIIIIVVFTAILLLSSIAILSVPSTSTCSNSYTPTSSVSNNLGGLYGLSDCYLQEEFNDVNTSFYGLFGLSMGLGSIKSLEIVTYIPIPLPVVFQMGSIANLYVSNIIDHTSLALFSFIKDLMEFLVLPLYILLRIIQYGSGESFFMLGLAIFLPIGIILRAFPTLRGIGGELIGIGMGIGLILPILLLFINQPITSYIAPVTTFPLITQTLGSEFSLSTSSPSAFASGLAGDVIAAAVNVFAAQELAFTLPVTASIGLSSSTSYITSCLSLGSCKNTFDPAVAFTYGFYLGIVNLATPSVYPLWNFLVDISLPILLFYLLLILDLILVIIISDSIARFLGGRVRLGIGKFKIA